MAMNVEAAMAIEAFREVSMAMATMVPIEMAGAVVRETPARTAMVVARSR